VWAGAGVRNVTGATAFDRFNWLAISPSIVFIEILLVPILLCIDYFGQLICFEFLVLGRM
jgi:hypothetical protein